METKIQMKRASWFRHFKPRTKWVTAVRKAFVVKPIKQVVDPKIQVKPRMVNTEFCIQDPEAGTRQFTQVAVHSALGGGCCATGLRVEPLVCVSDIEPALGRWHLR